MFIIDIRPKKCVIKLMFVPNCYKIKNMCNKAVDNCAYVYNFFLIAITPKNM